jgi:hypothetical protein
MTTTPLLVLGLIVLGMAQRFRRSGAKGILRQARSSPNGTYTLRLREGQVAWNPEGASQSWNVRGPGLASYRLERGAAGEVTVHVDYTPDGGPTRHSSGVVSGLKRQVVDGRRVAALLLSPAIPTVIQISLAVTGIVVGLVVTKGRAEGARVTGVLVGWGIGMVVPLLVGIIVLVGTAVRATVREIWSAESPTTFESCRRLLTDHA